MSHLEEQQCDPQAKNMSKIKKQKTISLVDYITDAKREESLIGLQYVEEIKILESDKSVVKCNLCNVKGPMANMKDHLVGTNHIKLYMERHYFSVVQSLKKASPHKAEFARMLKNYAKVIERAEGAQGVKIECASAVDMNKEKENWMEEEKGILQFHVDQEKFQMLDKRHMALNYSETFKIASREEAAIMLNLTQHLSDQLEQYFLKYKGPDASNSTTPDSVSTKSTPAPINFSPIFHENLLTQSDANQGFEKEVQWNTEKPSSSVCTPISVHSFDHVLFKDTKAVKRKSDASGDASHQSDEFQSRKKGRHQEHEYVLSKHSSSFSDLNVTGSPQHSSAEVSSSHSSSTVATYTHIGFPKEKSCVPETFWGNICMVNDTPQNNIPQNSLNDKISKTEAVQEIESLNCTDAASTSEVGAGTNTAIPGPSSSSSNCSYEPNSERPSSNHAQGKTSKTLSPDILNLLKGKDAHTVTKILQTLSPFYPALQEVNLEILAQVLVNTGALD